MGIVLTIVFAVLIEVFVFNFRFFQTMGYETVALKNMESDGSVTTDDGKIFHFSGNNTKLTFNDVNTEIKNIYFDIRCTKELPQNPSGDDIKGYEASKIVKVKVNADDYSRSGGIDMPERSIVSTVENTKYMFLNLKGETNTLKLTLNNVQDKDYYIKEISLNKSVPFSFNLKRVLILLIILFVLYIIRPGSRFYLYRLNLKSIKQKALLAFLLIIQTTVMLNALQINPNYVHNNISWHKQYIKLAEAIIEGHYYIDEEADERLSELENPYDPDERSEAGVSYSWDHAYYEGKYYVYFGILPALIFNIPAKVLFDVDIMPFDCIKILIPIFVLLSFMLIYILAKKFNDKGNISLLLYIILTLIFINGSGTSFVLTWPDLYMLPIFTAIVLGLGGLCCLLTAVVENKENNDYKLSKPKLFLGGLLLALIAGSRPQLLLLLFISIPVLQKAVFKDRRLFSKSSIGESLCFILPIIAVALFMFHYNYDRFGSIFDFGANYNLTTNDMTSRGIKPGRIPQGIFYYILQPLHFNGVFPYILPADVSTLFMGITIKEVMYGGIIFLQPLSFILFILPKIKDELKDKSLFGVTVMLTAFTFIIAAVDSLMSGILARYYTDIMWLLALASVIAVFAVYNKYKNREFVKLLNICVPVCLVLVVFMCYAVIIKTPAETNPELYWKIASSFQFWL
ncbi:MAG: hypothetical protein LUG66_01885 [Clostridiales bacterium]|nr:hypothetical protein [Clostridiales bacterium]